MKTITRMLHASRRSRFARLFFCFLFLLIVSSTSLVQAANADAGLDFHGKGVDRWYGLLIEGKPAGWSHTTIQIDPKNPQHIVSRNHLNMTLRRGVIVISIEQKEQFTETLDHKPLEVISYMSLGTLSTTRQDWRFTPEGIEIQTQEGDQKQKRTAPLPGEKWMTPAQSAEYVQGQIASGVKEFTYTKLEPSTGFKPVVYHSIVAGHQKTQVLGKVVPSILLKSTSSATPGIVMSEFVDEQGVSLRGVATLMPGMTMELVMADEAIAKSPISPPELVASTLLHPDRKIKEPRNVKAGKFELQFLRNITASKPASEIAEGEKPVKFELPVVGCQRVRWINATTVQVTIDLSKPVDASKDQPTAGCIAASTMINSDDPLVRGLVENAMKEKAADAASVGDASPMRMALMLRDFVHGFIEKKDLSVGFASASEVARTKEGDCTEHAVLLAALLRVRGIPSRTVSGLVYADEFLGEQAIFGYHMWTQAWLEDVKTKQSRWVDLDATLECGPTAFDATHIVLATSAMADGETFTDMLSMVSMIGHLQIRVLEP